MKHLLLVALVATSFSGLANANNGVYASVKAGVSDTKVKENTFEIRYSGTGYEKYSLEDSDLNDYPILSTAIGFDFSKISTIDARAELEYTYRGSKKLSQRMDYFTGNIPYKVDANHTMKSQSLMFNGYYDFKSRSKFTPYVSAGVGLTRLKKSESYFYNHIVGYESNSISNSDTDNLFTWSAGLGLTYAVNNNVSLDLSYKYIHTENFEFNSHLPNAGYLTGATSDNKLTGKISSQDYSLGIRYNF